MKLFEVTYNEDGIKLRRESEEHLTAEQKYYVIMASLATIVISLVILGFVALFR